MGKYYNVGDVESRGKPVSRRQGKKPHTAHKCVAVMDNGMRKIAVDVTRQSEFDHFYENYSQGFWLTMYLYDYKPCDLE